MRSFIPLAIAMALTAAGACGRTLVVESSPLTGVAIAASPADSAGLTGGTTQLALSYPDAAEVTLTAPNAVGRYRFLRWLKNGEPHESSTIARVTMNADHTLRAVYVEVSPTFPTNLGLMPLGDSITYGYNGGNAGYRGPLYTLINPLVTNFRYLGSSVERPGSLPLQPINQRFHEGHSSYNLQDISNNLDGLDTTRFLLLGGPDRNPAGGHWLIGGNGTGRPPLFPDVITLMAGHNDLNQMPGVEDRLVALLTKITTLRPDTRLIVAKVTPVPSLSSDEDYNLIISRVVGDFQAAGKNIHLVDLNTGFPANGLDPDGVHPNNTGFNWMASRWFEGIVAAYSPAAVERPFHPTPVAMPGTIELEDFNFGGPGIAYHDQSPTNEGGQYRPSERVEIGVSSDTGGGYQVFGTQAGEWLEYSVSVESAGGFTPSLRVATPAPGGEIYLEVDGVDATNNVALPDSGGNWVTVTLPEVQLSVGDHTLRLYIAATPPGGSAGSFNWISLAATSLDGPSAQAGPDLETMDQNNDGVEPITLNASGSTAGDSPTLTYTWWRGGTQIASGFTANVSLPVGTQIIQLKVTDGNGLSDTDEILVTVAPKTLVNGSFESGFTGWATFGALDIQTAAPYSPTQGVKLLGFNGGNQAASGVVTQTIATAVGGTYTVAFDAGALSYNLDTQTLRFTATGATNLLTQTIFITGPGGGANRWLPQSFSFVANSPITSLSFRDLSGSTAGIDLLLDNVRVTGPPALPINNAPVAAGESFSTNENIPLVVPAGGLLANDSDPDGNALVAVPNVLPRFGTLSLNLNGGFTYTPASGYYGPDWFTYHASDQFLNSNIVTVNLMVNEVIPPPVAAGDVYSTDENVPLAVPAAGVLTNDDDPRSRPLTAELDTHPSHGLLEFNSDGSFIYTPDPGHYGGDSFTYHCRNGFLNSEIVTVNLVIREVVPPPVAVADSYETDENIPLVIPAAGVLANDSDPRNRVITAIVVENPTHGSLVLSPNGGFTYTPADSYYGPDSFTYQANNGVLDSEPVVVSLFVHEVVPPPVAAGDSYSTDENLALTVPSNGVLANDSDPRNRNITALVATPPAHGTLALNPNGGFLYTPSAGFYGTDSFTYRANNGFLDSANATVDLTVVEVIPPPAAAPDAFVTDENIPLVIAGTGVLGNDSDPRGRPLTANLATGPAHGTLALNPDGGFTYTPAGGFYGTDSFTYFSRNGFLNSPTVTVSLTVNEVVPPPAGSEDFHSTDENVTLSVPASGVLANDSDPRGRSLTAVLGSQAGNGNVVLSSNGGFLYTPDSGYYGPDSFTYRANNGFLDSAEITVNLNVNEVIPPPAAAADSFVTDENQALLIPPGGVLTNDSDPRERPLSATLATGPANGSLVFNADGSFSYTPDPGYFGTDSFQYFARNGFLESGLATVNLTIREVVPPPSALGESYVTNEGVSLTVPASGVLSNDTDPRGRGLTAVISSQPANGTVVLNANGSFAFTPAPGFYGTTSFTYRANNGFLDSNTVTVGLTVNEVIPPPVAVADSFVTTESTPLVVPAGGVLGNDSDPRGRPISAQLVTGTSQGSLVLGPNGGFTYTPGAGFFGTDSFTYRIGNGFLNSNVVIVAIAVNEAVPPPVGAADSYTTSENLPLVVPANGVLSNDSDPRARPLAAILETTAVHGTVALSPNGGFTYTPATGYFGTDSFTYRASNGSVNSPPVTVGLSVNEVIPPPVAVADSFVTQENTPLTVPAGGVLANDSDPRGRPITALIESGPSHGTVTLGANGGFTYNPSPGYFGPDSFTYRARNGTLNSNVATVTLAIQEVVPPPVAVADSYSTLRGTILTIPAGGVLANDSDPRSRPLTAVLASAPGQGTLTLNTNGSFTYAPVIGFSGTDTFTYRARNGIVDSPVVTVTINVEGINFTGPVNGSFESGFANWTVSGSAAVHSSLPYVPTNGIRLVGFNGADAAASAVISQSFDTAPGDTYTLTFDLGVLAYNTSSQTLRVEVTGTGNLLTRTINIDGLGGGINRWLPQSFTFVANSPLSTLTFRDLSGATLNLDMTLDNVKVTGPPTIPTNTAPVAVADSYSTNQNTPLPIPAAGVLANDTDAQSQPLTATVSTTPSNGSLTLNPNGSFTYIPNSGFSGSDSFTYRANDGTLNSNIALVTITVISTNTAPVAVADSYSTGQDTLLVVAPSGVLANDTDAQAQPLTAMIDSPPSNGNVTLNLNGGFTYSPDSGFSGSDSFTYRANDGSLNSSAATVSLTVLQANTAPIAVADSYSTNQNTSLVVPAAGVLTNDTDAQSQPLTASINTFPSNGTITLNANGGFTYVPNSDFSGSDTFTYRANDGSLNSNVATVTLTVVPTNTAPVAVADSYSTNQNSLLAVPAPGILANDSDAQSQPLTAVLGTGTTNGTLTLSANGGFSYTPNSGFSGSDSFTYRASDGVLNSGFATVTLTVIPTNTAPSAVADSYSTNQNTALVVPAAGLLANDSDPQSQPLIAVLVSGPASGALVLNPNGGFTYTPSTGFSGSDSFTYKASDGSLDSNVVTVSLTVAAPVEVGLVNGSFESNFTGWTTSGVQHIQSGLPYVATAGSKLVGFNGANLTPNAVLSQSFATAVGTTYTLTFDLGVLAYNTSPQTMQVSVNGTGNLLSRTLTVFGVGGGVNFWAPQSFTFVANSTLTTLRFTDQSTASLGLDMTLDNVRITGPPMVINTPPVAGSDAYSTNQDTVLTVPAPGVLANDTDAQLQPLTAIPGTGPSHGSLILNPNGAFTYTPASGYSGADSFTYQASDGGLSSSPVTVSLNVVGIVPPPVAVADSYSTNEATTLIVPAAGVLGNDSDPESLPLTAILDAGPQQGSLTLSPDGSFIYTPDSGYFGPDGFTYRANNGSASSGATNVSLTVNEVIPAPLAVADSYSTSVNTALVVPATGVLANDSDPRQRPLTAILAGGPAYGSLTLSSNGNFTYTPNNGYSGSDSFTYRARNGFLNSNVATVSITISPVVTATLVNGSFEADYTGWTASGNQAIFSGAPYSATHGSKLAGFNPANLTPNAILSQTFATAPGQSYTLAFDAGVLSYNSNPQSMQVTVNGTGNLLTRSLTLFGSGNGNTVWTAQSFTFTADSSSTTLAFRDQSTSTLALDLVLDNVRISGGSPPVNTPPVAVADSYSTDQNTALVIPAPGVLSNDSDDQAQPLTAALNTSPSNGTVTLNSNGGFTYTPDSGFSGSDTFTYRASDGSLNSNVATVSVNVISSNTAPVASADSYSTNQDTPLVVPAAGVLANDTDAQSQPLTASINTPTSNGTVTLNASGGFTYTPNSGFSGSDSFTYRASDGSLSSNVSMVSLTVVPANTAPVAVADSYSTNQNTALVVPAAGVLSNDTDAQSQPLTAAINTPPSSGTVTLNANGSFTYTPNNGFSGSDSFTYRASDGSLSSNVASVNITVVAQVVVGLVNGSFESGFTGWTTSGSLLIQSTSPYQATHGTRLVGFNGGNQAASGVLSQTFATSPGQTCTLTFDAGVFSYNTNSQTLQVTVNGSGNLLSRTITLFGAGGGTNRWFPQSFTFVANSATTTLTFRDQSSSTIALDMILDNVRVSSAAPASAPAMAAALPPGPTAVAESDSLGPLTLTGTPGDFTIRMAATRNGTYVLERSGDLSVWERIEQMDVTAPHEIEFRDTRDPHDPRPLEEKMFYRIGRLPGPSAE